MILTLSTYEERAEQQQIINWLAEDGSALAYGRSLIRFAQVSFFSMSAAENWKCPYGIMKGLRTPLRFRTEHPIVTTADS